MDDEDAKERIRLVEADLVQTNDFIKGVLTVSAALRGSAITLWLTLLGFSFSQGLPELALLAMTVSLLFLLVDGYHGWLYSEALKHARAIESLLTRYYDTLSRYQDHPKALPRFLGTLRSHRFGLFLSFRAKFGVRSLFSARPTLIFRVLYPTLAALALAVFIAFATGVVEPREPAQSRDSNAAELRARPSSVRCIGEDSPGVAGLSRRNLVQVLRGLHSEVRAVQFQPAVAGGGDYSANLMNRRGRSVMRVEVRKDTSGWSLGHHTVCVTR